MARVEPVPPLMPPAVAADPSVGRDYLIRSEEQLNVTTARVPGGWARLEKFLVTETKTITVEVTHEEVRLVSEPTGAGGPASDPGAQKNQARWMYVSREEVAVTKRVVPVERVRLEVYPVTEQRQISDEVRKEQIDTAGLPVEGDPHQQY